MPKSRFFINIMCASILVIPNSVSAEITIDRNTSSYWEGKSGWKIYSYPDEDMCEMAKNQLPDEHFTLAYFPKDKVFGLVFTNANATSLEGGSSVKLNVVLKKNGPIDLGWGSKDFEIVTTDGNVAFSTFLHSPIDTDIAQSESISIFRKDVAGKPVIVAFVDLDGSSEAIKKLISCAIIAAKLNPNDPFLK